jgi:hypothetical protein
MLERKMLHHWFFIFFFVVYLYLFWYVHGYNLVLGLILDLRVVFMIFDI